jgi:hypothetical protein
VGKHLAHGQQLAALAARTLPISLPKWGVPAFYPSPKTPEKKDNIFGAVPDNADMCYWIGDEEESIKQGEAG